MRLDLDRVTMLPDYREWLERLRSTYESVTFCCRHRLGDRALAESVGLRVVAGLVERPTIFQFSGLPYSGRIGTLAERWIKDAKAGGPKAVGQWQAFAMALAAVPLAHQETFVGVCVWGRDDVETAELAGCTEDAARERRERTLTYFEALARRAVTSQFDRGSL